mmetsp:Transcript_73385/g.144009  ORF Transcript_73385/g.144009 Transcript_73385/m.144009 type:complete len:343 (-) Transcript_73385:563-1591(-)
MIKNTFVCVEEQDASSPRECVRRRAQTSDVDWLCDPVANATGVSAVSEELGSGTRLGPESTRAVTSSVESAPAQHDGQESRPSPRSTSASPSGSMDARGSAPPSRGSCGPVVQDLWTTVARSPQVSPLALANAAFDEGRALAVHERLGSAPVAELRAIAGAFRGRVNQAARSPFARPVLEGLIARLPSEDVAFFADELRIGGYFAAWNINSQNVLCRLLEFLPNHQATVRLIDEVALLDTTSLCCHKFGHLVAMSILSNGLIYQKIKIVRALTSHLQRCARHRHAACVIEQNRHWSSVAARSATIWFLTCCGSREAASPSSLAIASGPASCERCRRCPAHMM